ncbi:hypothetical protein E2C01_023866 [Portunus trituberculatus]|uniref:Uncharacterized protein n=1 Tax=Portunus trituberculatus TaxID=210409 RepID=A0A5B7EB77_PORTR|nr:hypothetical protein [Portunus trituberculatus]
MRGVHLLLFHQLINARPCPHAELLRDDDIPASRISYSLGDPRTAGQSRCTQGANSGQSYNSYALKPGTRWCFIHPELRRISRGQAVTRSAASRRRCHHVDK